MGRKHFVGAVTGRARSSPLASSGSSIDGGEIVTPAIPLAASQRAP